MKSGFMLFVLGFLLVARASTLDSAMPQENILTVDVIGQRAFQVGDHKFREYSLARTIKRLYASNPRLSVRFRIPLRLIDTIYKQDTCYALVGYVVRSSFPLQLQSFYEWVPGNPSTVKEIPCDFAIVADLVMGANYSFQRTAGAILD